MLEGLLFRADAKDDKVTQQGVPRYLGGSTGFETWKFKIENKVKAIKASIDEEGDATLRRAEEKLIELGSKIVDALEDDALRIAVELGHETLNSEGGIAKLMKKLEDEILFGDKDDDIHDLFRIGCLKKGPLSRQVNPWSATLPVADVGGSRCRT